MADRYDVAIIGSGPGGYVAGIRAGQLGLRAVVIEREPALGGVCLNWGCIPTKALIKNAEMVAFLKKHAAEFGIVVKDPEISWTKGVERSGRVVQRMNRGVAGLLKKHKCDVVQGTARFADAGTLEVTAPDGAATRVAAAHIVIATGSRSRMLPGITADGERILTSRHAVRLDAVPRRLVIMGSGAVGMEFGYVYNAYGAEVTIVEMLDRVLPLEDADASALVRKAFERSGIDIRTGTKVDAVAKTKTGVALTLSPTAGGGTPETLEGDQVLVAIGRAPNTEDLGLEAVGVQTERGFVKVDADLRSTVPHIFAIGDVAGPPMLAHKAMHEGVQVVEHLAGRPTHPVDATFIPNCTYCQPQVASIGMTEAKAREAGYSVKVSQFPFVGVGKSVAIGETEGWVKIVSDARYGEILGATIVGPEATELIHELVLARTAELTADELVGMVHAHPTLSEAIHEAALGVDGLPLHI
ncbi:dihydrolipoyl dehydrogenase [bacterium]|nr:dihydrolipoyl dehydrogenase [Chloroflexi bacterium CFX6]RIL05657.1 MAG: dihydrolipoyl dehydrogenase [bacterium]